MPWMFHFHLPWCNTVVRSYPLAGRPNRWRILAYNSCPLWLIYMTWTLRHFLHPLGQTCCSGKRLMSHGLVVPLPWKLMSCPEYYTSYRRYLYFCQSPYLPPSDSYSQILFGMGGLPQISLCTLSLPKCAGGLGLPHMKRYHWTFHLIRIVDWNIHHSPKDWMTLEQMVITFALSLAPWTPGAQINEAIRGHPLVGTTLRGFKTVTSSTNIISIPGPMTPLRRHNVDFSPGLCAAFLLHQWPDHSPEAGEFFEDGRLKECFSLILGEGSPQILWWSYLQVRHFLTTGHNKGKYTRDQFWIALFLRLFRSHLTSTRIFQFLWRFLCQSRSRL